MSNDKVQIRKRERDVMILHGGKIPPQDKEAEKSILGLMMLEPKTLDKVLPILRMDDFYVDAHQKIFNAMIKLHVGGSSIDMITVIDQLNKTSELEMVGGPYYLAEMTVKVVTSAHLLSWCLIVKEHSIKRSICKIAGQFYNESFDYNTDALDLLSKMQVQLSQIQDSFASQKVTKFIEVMIETVQEMEAMAMDDNPYLGVRCGLDSVDDVTLGFSAPDLIILAAGPGEGKSTFMLQSALNIGTSGDGVAVFSLEMKNRQLMWKVFSSLIEEDIKTIRKGKLTEEKWKLLHSIMNEKLASANIWMHDKGGISVIELCSVVRTLVAKQGIKIVFIDYLQLLTAGTERGFGTRESEVNFISKTLKQLAMELNIPVVALSQLSRIEKGAKRMYKLSDLRESGAIEQDADGVMFIWRPKYHDVTRLTTEDPPFADNDVLLYTAKWRLGDTGNIKLKFNGKYSRFEDYPEDNFESVNIKPLEEVLQQQREKQQWQAPVPTNWNNPNDLPF